MRHHPPLRDYETSLVADEQDGADLHADRSALSDYDMLRERALALPRAGKKDEGRERGTHPMPISAFTMAVCSPSRGAGRLSVSAAPENCRGERTEGSRPPA